MVSLFKKKLNVKNINTGENLQPICPYCKEILDKIPKRKSKCSFCKKDIYVRSRQKIFSSNILKKDDAIAVDWFKRLEDFGIKVNDFSDKRIELSKKFGQEAKSTDVIWGLFNKLILKETDLQELKILYFEMALFLNNENKDSVWVAQLSHEMELKYWKQQRVIKGVEIFADQCCDECRKLHKKVLTIDEAIEEKLLPNPDCTNKLKKRVLRHGVHVCTLLLPNPLPTPFSEFEL